MLQESDERIIKVIFFYCISGVLTQRLNYTQRFEKRLFSQFNDPSNKIDTVEAWRSIKIPAFYSTVLSQQIPILPEENYNDVKDETDDDQELPEIELTRDDRNLLPEYRSLCQTKTNKIELSDSQYEYQPSHYYEIYCKSYSFADRIHALTKPSQQQICAHPSFHCVQRSKTMFMIRRRWESDCWEPYTKQVPSGCECMWPVSTLGEISGHY